MKLSGVFLTAFVIHCIAGRVIEPSDPTTDTSNETSSLNNTSLNADSPSLRPAIGFFADDVASPEDFTQYANKGGALICGLTGTDKIAGTLMRDPRNPPSAASMWRGDLRQELQTWYWRNVNPATYSCKLDEHWQFPYAMKDLGLSGKPIDEGGDNACFRVEHWDPNKEENGRQVPAINQWYTVGDKDYRATMAHYEFAINTKGGGKSLAIFNFFLEGPKAAARSQWYAGRKDAVSEDLPQLRALSDVLWGFWNRDNANIRNIRYLFMIGISNDLTEALIASCLKKAGKQLSEWPGTSFSTATDEGHVLLGSPNGAAFAYFLMQHKAELGHKTVSRVTVFRPENEDDSDFVDASLVFHVEDAPEPPPDEGEMAVPATKAQPGKNFVRVHKL